MPLPHVLLLIAAVIACAGLTILGLRVLPAFAAAMPLLIGGALMLRLMLRARRR